MSETSRGISRRTLVKGTAWAVPAVAVASAAPAMALSGGGPTLTILQACKQPGGSCEKDGFPKFGYTFVVRVDNPTNQSVYIYTNTANVPAPYLSVIDVNNLNFSYGGAQLFTPPSTKGGSPGNYQEIQPGVPLYLLVSSTDGKNSANVSITGSLYLPWGHTTTAGDDPDHPYTPAPPASPLGEGWFGTTFSFPDTPPCDNKTCLPTITTTTTTAPPATAAREAAPAEPEALVETDAPLDAAAPAEAPAPAAAPAPVEAAAAPVEAAAAPVEAAAPAVEAVS